MVRPSNTDTNAIVTETDQVGILNVIADEVGLLNAVYDKVGLLNLLIDTIGISNTIVDTSTIGLTFYYGGDIIDPTDIVTYGADDINYGGYLR